MEVRTRIRDITEEDFWLGFLKICPVPIVDFADHSDPNNPVPPDMQLQYTRRQWLKKVIRHDLFDKYKQGKMLLAREGEVIDEGVIE